MNNKGQMIITDMILYIIISIIILSAIIYAIETLNDGQVTSINNRQLKSVLEDNISLLTKTTGKPENWEKLNDNDVETIGLRSTRSGTLSYDKIIRLKNSPRLLEKCFFPEVDYSLTLYQKNNPDRRKTIGQKGDFNNKKQILSKSVPVILDYGYKITSITESNESCPYEHDKGWMCKTLSIDENTLGHGKYYLISDSNIEYILSNTLLENVTGQTRKACINSQMKRLTGNDNRTLCLHTKGGTNYTFLVYDTNDREEFLESVIRPEVHVLELKIAV